MKLLNSTVALLIALALSGQCVPDSTLSGGQFFAPPPGSQWDPGTQLFFMPNATVNQPYSVDIAFRIPKDTTIMMVQAGIDSVAFLGLTNLPSNFQETCNRSSCVYPGGSFGCFRVSGTPTMADTLQLGIQARFYISVPLIGQITRQSTIDAGIAVAILNNISVKEEAGSTLNFSVYPNPAHNKLHIRGNTQAEVAFHLCDMLGKTLINTTLAANAKREIDVSHLPKGHYSYRIITAEGSRNGKIQIRRP